MGRAVLAVHLALARAACRTAQSCGQPAALQAAQLFRGSAKANTLSRITGNSRICPPFIPLWLTAMHSTASERMHSAHHSKACSGTLLRACCTSIAEIETLDVVVSGGTLWGWKHGCRCVLYCSFTTGGPHLWSGPSAVLADALPAQQPASQPAWHNTAVWCSRVATVLMPNTSQPDGRPLAHPPARLSAIQCAH